MATIYTPRQIDKLIGDPSTRRLVFEVLKLARHRDRVDAAKDVETAASILASRLHWAEPNAPSPDPAREPTVRDRLAHLDKPAGRD